jgi:hypothetical protein
VVAGANNAVSLDWTPIPGALSYKLYRTTVSGTYGASSLVASVTTPPVTDIAAATSAGTPPAANGATGDVFLTFGGTPAATFTAGPDASNSVDFGGFSLLRSNGTFLIVHGKNGTSTSI